MIKITHDMARLPIWLNKVSEQAIKKATVRSMKRTITSVQTKSAKDLRGNGLIDMESKEIKTRMKLSSNYKAALEDLFAILTFRAKGEGLHKFFARPVIRNKRIAAQVRVFGKTYIPGYNMAFMGKNTTGNKKLVFLRKSNPDGSFVGRTPIRKLWGPSISQLIEMTGMLTKLLNLAQTRYETEYLRNFNFYMEKI